MNGYFKILVWFIIGLMMAMLLLMDLIIISETLHENNKSDIDDLGIVIIFGMYFILPVFGCSFICPIITIILWKKLTRNNKVIGLFLPILIAILVYFTIYLQQFYIPFIVDILNYIV